MNVMNFLEELSKRAELVKNEGDYFKDNLLHCGVCNEPKQAVKEIPFADNKKLIVTLQCKCQREEDEKQRLALARAILHDSPVLIFDEATSNIDIESEEAILKEIRKLAKEKTVVMISHRLANVVDADRIYVMEEGSVAERGRHEELLLKNGVYARLWKTQDALENYGKEALT